MSKRNFRELFAKVVCANAPFVIAVAVCLMGLSSVLVLAAVLPGVWSLVAFAVALLAGCFPLLRRLRGRAVVLESMRLEVGGVDEKPVNGSVKPASVPTGAPVRTRPALETVLNFR
jgi:hypothetical protein